VLQFLTKLTNDLPLSLFQSTILGEQTIWIHSMKKKISKNALDLIFKKVQLYIELEYDEDTKNKMLNPKYHTIVRPYISNCISLNKSIPYIANGVVRFIRNTNCPLE
jgi:hypothetical protein